MVGIFPSAPSRSGGLFVPPAKTESAFRQVRRLEKRLQFVP
jgi:hypothetical protein